MRRFVIVAAIGVGLFGGFATPAAATVEHCPDHEGHPGKIEDPARDHVPTAGSEICVKAGANSDQDGGNTGRLTADGTTTLADYLKAAGIVGGDGEGRNPSYLIVYVYVPPATTTTTTAPPPDEPPVTTTTSVPPADPPATTTTTEAPHNVCPDGTGHTFKTDQPCPPPIETVECDGWTVLASVGCEGEYGRVPELPRTGTDWVLPLALLGLGAAIAGGLLIYTTRR